jgi:hypothetical protein
VNSTEIRTYSDQNNNPVNRTVNIVNLTAFSPSMNITYSNVTVYDKITGLLLELNYTWTNNVSASFGVSEARFKAEEPEDITRYYYYAAIITAVVVVVAVIIVRRRRTGYVEISPEEAPKEEQ